MLMLTNLTPPHLTEMAFVPSPELCTGDVRFDRVPTLKLINLTSESLMGGFR